MCPCGCRVAVRRYDGDLDMPVSVSFSTRDGTAIAGLDYKPVQVCCIFFFSLAGDSLLSMLCLSLSLSVYSELAHKY